MIRVTQGDITEQNVDVIVNAANPSLLGGGGVDGAIHEAGGPDVTESCRRLGHCAPGDAVITSAGNLPAKFVIHTVGPVWYGGNAGEPDILRAAYKNSLQLAEDYHLSTIAFPSISTGVYGYPIELASRIAWNEAHKTRLAVTFVLFSEHDFNVYCHYPASQGRIDAFNGTEQQSSIPAYVAAYENYRKIHG